MSNNLIDAELLLDEGRRLWNLETYKDRHGKTRLRMTLRFSDPPVREELGVITEALAAALQERGRRGRWKHSREAAVALRPLVEAIAESHRRLRSRRKKGAGPGKKAGVKPKQGSKAVVGTPTEQSGPSAAGEGGR